jgi:DNA-binding transcriptional MerR regulator
MEKSPEAFRTISEVADWLDTPAHVLRFWESRFAQVKPVKRAGGRRYYRPSDMALLGGIKKLLHEDGMTIRGVQKILRTEGVRHVAALSPPIDDFQDAFLHDPVDAPAADPEGPARREAATGRPVPPPVPPAPQPPAPVHADAPAAQAELDLSPAEHAADPDHGTRTQTETSGPDEAPEEALADEPAGSMPEAAAAAADEAGSPALPATAAPVTPAPAWQPPDLSAVPPMPEDDDPSFAGRPSPFPLADPRGARTRLARAPARAAALYERLIALGERMDRTR